MPAFSRSVGYLGNAWCSSDSQILARNTVFVVTVACNSKTTQSALCLDEASAECQARTPLEKIQRKSRVREWTPQNAPRIRAGVTKRVQKAELKKNQTRRCYFKKARFFFTRR